MSKRVVLAMSTVLILSACTIAKVSGRGAIPILLNNPAQKVTVLKHVVVEKMITFDYTDTYDASVLLADEIAAAKADAIINTSFEVKSTGGTFFVNLFTLGLANAKTVNVSGDLVKYQ